MKLKILLGSLVFLLVASACGINVDLNTRNIRGSGDAATETRSVSGFDEVVLAGSAELYIEQGSDERLTVTADDNLLDVIRTEVEGNTLVLGFKNNVSAAPRTPIVFKLTVRDLSVLTLAGSGKIVTESLDTPKLTLNLPGSGSMDFERVETGSLHVILAGSGAITIQAGTSDSAEVNMLGSGTFDGANFEVEDATAVIAGSGDIHVRCTRQLDGKILGSGNIRYYGDPGSVDVDTAGSGNFENMGR
jgi:hypothetical protein